VFSWKRPGLRLSIKGISLSKEILKERGVSNDFKQLDAARNSKMKVLKI